MIQKTKKEYFLDDLAFAIEQNSYEMEYFLDRKTMTLLLRTPEMPAFIEDTTDDDGEVIDLPDWVGVDDLPSFEPGRHIPIEPMQSRQSFEIMERFAMGEAKVPYQQKLIDALGKKHPFRHFKEVVEYYEGLRQQWFQYKNNVMLNMALSWLEEQGIDIENFEFTEG